MSRPSVRRAEIDRKKDVALMWTIEWLRDISASLEVMIDLTSVVDSPIGHYRVSLVETQEKVDKMIRKMFGEPA